MSTWVSVFSENAKKKKSSFLTSGLNNNILGASQDSQQFFWREKGEETSEPALSLL